MTPALVRRIGATTSSKDLASLSLALARLAVAGRDVVLQQVISRGATARMLPGTDVLDRVPPRS